MSYREAKIKARFRSTQPTKTDQSMAKSTDINVIVKGFAVSGTIPGGMRPAIYGDFTNLPRDLKEAMEQGKEAKKLRSQLPPQLRNMSTDELLSLTPEKISQILKPAEPAKPRRDEDVEDRRTSRQASGVLSETDGRREHERTDGGPRQRDQQPRGQT